MNLLTDPAGCRQCRRLVDHMASVRPRRGLSSADYWSRPVAGFGDPAARICLVGLAPGAHGANRTGRPFTGDGAGDFMYPLLHRAGLASQPEVSHRDDGLSLQDLYITNAVKCLPPENRPTPSEFEACRRFLARELARLTRLRVIIALGAGAHASLLHLFKAQGAIRRLADYRFGHAACFALPDGLWLVSCYHTSRYNVQTGRINEQMFMNVLDRALALADRSLQARIQVEKNLGNPITS
jgi:uracil-DNA glycosylase family 4